MERTPRSGRYPFSRNTCTKWKWTTSLIRNFWIVACIYAAPVFATSYTQLPHDALHLLVEYYQTSQNTEHQQNIIHEITSRLNCTQSEAFTICTRKEGIQLTRFQRKTPITTWQESTPLLAHQVDIGRTLLLFEYNNALTKVIEKEKYLDWIATRALYKAGRNASEEEIIHALNHTIFFEEKIRFPPYHLYQIGIDQYTSLGQIIESKQGVCLGVSLLYYAVAERLGLQLELITPPGHAYLKWNSINIETTARGIHLPTENFYTYEETCFQPRSPKEFLGLAIINRASHYLQTEEWEEAHRLLVQATPFLENDPTAKVLAGMIQLKLAGAKKELTQLATEDLPHSMKELLEDILEENITIDGALLLFRPEVWSRNALIEEKERLLHVLQKYPRFRQGWLALGSAELSLYNLPDSIKAFKNYLSLTSEQPAILELLTTLHLEMLNKKEARATLQQLENLIPSTHPLYWKVAQLKTVL